MYKFLTSKKGFTIVELMIVLALLSLGVFAIANLFTAAYRSFNKTEERYLKQEAVKTAAEMLRKGETNVASATNADIFNTLEVIPTAESVDKSYSYLYAEAHYKCSECEETWPATGNVCVNANCTGSKTPDGFYLYNLNKGVKRANATQIVDVPIYVTITPFRDSDIEDGPVKNQCGVMITLAALEDDYDYSTGNPPISDDIYYSLDVSYHFPNMATSESGVRVNYPEEDTLAFANTYNSDGTLKKTATAGDYVTVPCTGADAGIVLRVYADSIISGDNTNTSISMPKLCFIATASYGEDSGEVGMLCDFRDKCLLTNPLGEAFVKAYYKLSPPIADIIRESEFLKGAVRTALKPLIVVAEYSLNEDIRPVGAISLVVFMLSGTAATLMLMRVDKRKKSRGTVVR